tara:strand:- start:3107 stop:3331 length:225 start_codon:yes stop_codon:yes gene_type:complete
LGVSFPLAAKTPVICGNDHPFYSWVERTVGEAAAPRWNFHKYLPDSEDNLVKVFSSTIAPHAPELSKAIDRLPI